MTKNSTNEFSSTRKKLFALQKRGFLFHGSSHKIAVLQLRQPVNFNIKKNKYLIHGKPCVAATPYADIAVFRAIVNKTNFPSRSKSYAATFGINSRTKKLNLKTTQRVIENLSNQHGYVHVVDKEKFSKRSIWEWRSSKIVKPLKVIKVSVRDLNRDAMKMIDYDFKIIKNYKK